MRLNGKTKLFLLVVGFFLLLCGLHGNSFKTFPNQFISKTDLYVVTNIETDLQILSKEIESNFRIIESNNKPLSNLSLSSPTNVSYFKLLDGKLISWSGFEYDIPVVRNQKGNSDFVSFENSKGVFLLKSHVTSDGFELIALVVIHRTYSIENKFLNEDIEKDFIGKYKVKSFILGQVDTKPILNSSKQVLFHVSSSDQSNGKSSIYWFRWLLVTVGFSFILMGFYLVFKDFEEKGYYILNFIVLSVFLIVLRFIILNSGFPNSLVEVEWFKSTYFASSFWFPSFGDFVINLVLVLILGFYFFLRLDNVKTFIQFFGSRKSLGIPLITLAIVLLGIILYLYYWGIFVLHKDAQWNFDISKSVELNYYTISYLLIFVFLSIIAFLFSYFVIRIASFICARLNVSKLKLLLTSLVLVFSNLIMGIPWEVIVVFYIYVFVAVYFKLYSRLRDFNFKSYLFLVLSAFSFSLIAAFILIQHTSISEEVNKKKFATKILDNSDLELEYLLGNISTRLKSDSIVLKTLPNIWTAKDVIISRIQNDYVRHGFERYDLVIHLFDKYGNGYFKNTIDDTYFDLRRKFTQRDYVTNTKNLYHLSIYGGVLHEKYVHFIQIKIGAKVVGYIVLELALKKIKAHSLYPLLVNNYETNKQLLLSGYDYAIYEKGELVFNHGNFQYPKLVNVSVEGRTYDLKGYNHYQTNTYKSKQIVISSPKNLVNVFMANFSYLFIILVFCVFLTLLFVSLFNQKKLSNFSTKIQIYLNLACFLPLIVVSISTISVLNDNYKEDLNTTFIQRAQSIGGNIDDYVDRYKDKQIALEELDMVLNKISEYTLTDINLYDVDGELILSSQQALFEMGLLSNLMNPRAKVNLENQKNVTLLEEKIGAFEYRSVYLSLQSPNSGTQIGLISIPFFNSENELNAKRVAVLSTYMNVFSVAFLLILLLSQVAYNSITNPLRFIADKLKRISFTGVNEELDWSSEDEIGLLVNEYNNMLHKLEESKIALSQSEKEFAWREMAQQVAHEIKNPLTPMKLSMQHMRRVGVDDPEKLRNSIDSMLSQIETLNDIASSFSEFAKMPTPESEKYDIKTVFNEIVSLYDNEEVGLICTLPDDESIEVVGDDKVMGRMLTNLVINGIQAYAGDGVPKIELHMIASSTDVLIEIKDNGEGIPEEIQSKVFMPNFSTKYTGSGIGLAVVKRGVEHAQGNIWFSTEEGIGTTFYIKLPRVFSADA